MRRSSHAEEVARGERFQFGRNWSRFLSLIGDDRISAAEHSLQEAMGAGTLPGKRFLDIGSGSGLFSLAARRLGATVHSFDYDPESVACTLELRRRYRPDDSAWKVEHGSVLDRDYLAGLGQFDVVYSWGVLHHTGAMWQALENTLPLVAGEGYLYIALYNDQGARSDRWRAIKRAYNRSGPLGRGFIVAAVLGLAGCYRAATGVARLPARLLGRDAPRKPNLMSNVRGMHWWRDLIDWVGGYPFEVATPQAVRSFVEPHGFELTWITTTTSLGCNQFVFRRHVNDHTARHINC